MEPAKDIMRTVYRFVYFCLASEDSLGDEHRSAILISFAGKPRHPK
jgi:hypothetical protein